MVVFIVRYHEITPHWRQDNHHEHTHTILHTHTQTCTSYLPC
jgi:hypothetical protein